MQSEVKMSQIVYELGQVKCVSCQSPVHPATELAAIRLHEFGKCFPKPFCNACWTRNGHETAKKKPKTNQNWRKGYTK